MEKTLAELFARLLADEGFDGNPMGVFCATISEEEYIGRMRLQRQLGCMGDSTLSVSTQVSVVVDSVVG